MDNRYRKAIPLTLAKPTDILPCTLDLLILRTLELGPLHGVAIADRDDRLFDAGARPSENFVTWSNRGEQALHRLQSLFATDPGRQLFRPLHRGYQDGIWVNRLPLPPPPVRPHLEDSKMQVGRARIRISSRSDKTDDVPTLDPHSLPQPFHVPVQVRVVVAIPSHFVELVYRVAARFAEEQFADGSGYDCIHGCSSWLQNVDGLMPMPIVNLFEHVP